MSRNSRYHRHVKLLTLAGVACTLAAPVDAQILEEVVVVARKREENLQDTPVAVSAFSNEQLRADRIQNISDLARQVPGLSNRDGEKESGLTIRGVGARARNAKSDPGVGVYVDGIFMPRSDTQLVDVVDAESIQVLRGPQGTLFGKNTAGGAILIQSRKPEEEPAAQVDISLGDYDRRELNARVDGPIYGDKLFGALTYQRRKVDGYMEDDFTGAEYGNIDRQAVVGQLRYYPTDSLTIDLIALWGERKENAAPYSCISYFNTDAQFNIFASTAVEGSFEEACNASRKLANNDKVLMDYTVPLQFNVTNNLAGLTLNWELGEISLRSVTGYLQQDDLARDTDADGTQFVSIGHPSAVARQFDENGINGDGEARSFISQEFNLFGNLFDEKVDYTLGLYYSNENIDDQVDGTVLFPGAWAGVAQPEDMALTLAPGRAGLNGAALVDLSSESAAAFGQFIFHISDYWQFTLGGRYTWEEKTIDQYNYTSSQESLGLITGEEYRDLRGFIQPVVLADIPLIEDDETWAEFSPSATVTAFIPDGWTEGVLDSGMLYLTYSEGFKAGGFSSFGLEDPTQFDPETVKNYEFGFKLEFWGQRLRLNGALYHMDYDDIQLQVTRTFAQFDTRLGFTNAGQAEMEGAELEIVVVPVSGLMINLSGSYIDANYGEFIDTFENAAGEIITSDRKNEPFAYLPEQTYSWGVQYDLDTEFALMTPRISGFYKDEIYLGQDPESAEFVDEATLDDFTVWNARLAVAPNQVEDMEIAVFVDNLTDETYYGSGIVNTANVGATTGIRGMPRNWGVSFFYTW